MPPRILADFSEAPFYGNEWASVGRLLGVVVAFLLNPVLPVCGGGLLPALLAAQVLSAAIAVPLAVAEPMGAGGLVPVVRAGRLGRTGVRSAALAAAGRRWPDPQPAARGCGVCDRLACLHCRYLGDRASALVVDC